MHAISHFFFQDRRIHRFIRLLCLCTSTFQNFLDFKRDVATSSDIEQSLSPWLLQECFNTICATAIVVIDVCAESMTDCIEEKRKVMHGTLNLLLLIVTSPQSSVTHLRAVGGSLHALELDADLFLDVCGSNFQHWVRIILSLMNSSSLSVRSIAVDFVVSLLGSAFELHASIDSLTIIFASVLPEVVAREIALFSVGGHISTLDDVARAVWPIRRSIVDLGDADPLDDDRVDPQLAPVLASFCRSCQAIIDGVIVEMRLQGEDTVIVGTRVESSSKTETAFDAEEESVFEAANFFVAESAPMQKIRWLMTLKSLHVSKLNWAEAAEALILCAHTICDAIPHLKAIWRPSRFGLWSDSRRSMWLDTIGEDVGHPDRGNTEVMDFAEKFLEPDHLLGKVVQTAATGKLLSPTLSILCEILTSVSKDAVAFLAKEHGMDDLTYGHLEGILTRLMSVVDDHNSQKTFTASLRSIKPAAWMRHKEGEAALRKALTCISGQMTNLVEGMVTMEQQHRKLQLSPLRGFCFVRIRVYGMKPRRFEESTTIPTFLEWDKPCVCRVPTMIADKYRGEGACLEFVKPLLSSLQSICGEDSVVLRTIHEDQQHVDDGVTYLDVFHVDAMESSPPQASFGTKHFLHRKGTILIKTTVAHKFPCALSRQTCLLTADIAATRSPSARHL